MGCRGSEVQILSPRPQAGDDDDDTANDGNNGDGKTAMRILITNDDGYAATGIAALCEALRGLGEISVVAPKENRSGVSAALSLRRKITVTPRGKGAFVVDGTPADCVHLSMHGDFVPRPDIVVAGVNDGPNLGEDTVYSGTVAAAVCAHLHNIPAIAVSMAASDPSHFASAAQFVRALLQTAEGHLVNGAATALNINVPDLPPQQIRGSSVTRLGRRGFPNPPMRHANGNSGNGGDDCNDNDMLFEVGAAGEAEDGGEGTDFYAVARKLVSVTPLFVGATDARAAKNIREWLSDEN